MTIVSKQQEGDIEVFAAINESEIHFTDQHVAQVKEMIAVKMQKFHLPEAYVQRMISLYSESITKELAALFQARVKSFSDVMVRRVRVDRASPEKIILALEKRAKGLIPRNMPAGEGEEVDVYFFPAPDNPNSYDINAALKHHGLKTDPYALAQVNIDDPEFASKYPNATVWLQNDQLGTNFSQILFAKGYVKTYDYYQRLGSGWWVGGVLA